VKLNKEREKSIKRRKREEGGDNKRKRGKKIGKN
jgi:hypothetical protein